MKTLITPLLLLATILLIAGCSNNPTETNNVPPLVGNKDMRFVIVTSSPPDTADYTVNLLKFTLSDSTLRAVKPSGEVVYYTSFYRTVNYFALMQIKITDTMYVSIIDLDNREWNYEVINTYYSKPNDKMTFTPFQTAEPFTQFSKRVKSFTIK